MVKNTQSMVKKPINGCNNKLLVDPKMRKNGKTIINKKLQVGPKVK
jgi:hypothetical protein